MYDDVTRGRGVRVEDVVLVLPSWPRSGLLHCVRAVRICRIWLSLRVSDSGPTLNSKVSGGSSGGP